MVVTVLLVIWFFFFSLVVGCGCHMEVVAGGVNVCGGGGGGCAWLKGFCGGYFLFYFNEFSILF